MERRSMPGWCAVSGANKQDAAVERFVARLSAAALLHPEDATVLFIRELINRNGLKTAVQHYSHMLEWLPK